MSLMDRPACLSAAGMATAGPMPITSGGTPTTANARKMPTMGMPCFSAKERFANSTAAAPSDTWLELPAVVVPPFLKAGLSLARSAAPTPLRMPSSAVTVTVRSLPSLSFTTVVTGTISSAYRPSSCARHALRWDSTAILSCMSRVMPYAAATFSEVMPMGSRQLRACSLASTAGDILAGSMEFIMSARDMVSTPPARPHSYSPALMALATVATACKPEEHCRLMPCSGTE
mmetsp:Transcript_3368/g.6272  ORF Transcript_3368/g.6272 Transcript_3368/m.6272 type:complete len:231 (-) Transcript_3368:111-803(-)